MESSKIAVQMRKGLLEFCILSVIAQGQIYASDILRKLTEADLIVVEGTIYPLLNRLTKEGLLEYQWVESNEGPPRKYYSLTKKGMRHLKEADRSWKELNKAINILKKKK